jgi:HSP20 family protein
MALVRWQRNENDLPVFSNFFDNFLTRDMDEFFGNTFQHKVPAVNIRETRDDFRIDLAAPGLARENFKINLDHNMITIEAGKQDEKTENGERYTRKEFNYSSFQRTFTLPDSVEADKIDAKYQDGIMHVIIPKKEEVKSRLKREILIQ